MEKVIQWYGKYRGIKFEISKWFMGGRECWAYYLIVDSKQLPEDNKFSLRPVRGKTNIGGRAYFKYEESFWGRLDWHGGITFYEKRWNEVGKLEGFKVGCDYQHLFDRESKYTPESIEKDCKLCIDSLWTYLPNIKVWCLQNGSYHPLGVCPYKLDREELGGY